MTDRQASERTQVLRSRVRPPAASGLRRVRLLDPVTGPRAARVGLVVAPAGCGKTTLLAHIAERVGRLVWVTLDQDLGGAETILAHLAVGFAAIPDLAGGEWTSPGDLLNALESDLREPVVLVLDDLHSIAGTPALDVVRMLVAHQPPSLQLILGGRCLPDVGMERRRLTAEVHEIGADDLRFRTWEVEDLFRTCHDLRLGSGEVARLTQRTAGWAAGLQLFHLATANRSPAVRQSLLADAGSGRLTGRYLAEQVLQQLPAAVRDFVLRTSVLARLDARRCDQLLGTTGSEEMLAELDVAGLLDSRADLPGIEAREYRYHEVLQTHLLDQLEARLGAAEARELHQRAGQCWQQAGEHANAVRSFCRAQDWDSVREVIRIGGHDLAADHGSWLDLVPEQIRVTDPWVMVAVARRLLADGSLQAAIDAYDAAVDAFGGLSGTETAARELRAVRSWTAPPPGTVDDPYHQLRLAFIDPAQVRAPSDASPIRWCAYGVAGLGQGRLSEAATAFDSAMRQVDVTPVIETLAAMGLAVALTMLGDPAAAEARQRAGMIASAVELPGLERIGDGLIRLLAPPTAADPVELVDDLLAACRSAGDEWGEALLLFFAAVRGLSIGRASVQTAHRAVERLTAIDAPALVSWASLVEAVAAARAGTPWSRADLDQLEHKAATLGRAPYAMALLAASISTTDTDSVNRFRRGAAALVERTPMARWVERIIGVEDSRRDRAEVAAADSSLPTMRQGSTRPAAVAPSVSPERPDGCGVLRVEVLGGLRVALGGEPVATAGLRPQHRELFAVLCAHADRVVHRDQLVEWFWQDSDPVRAQHSLQVAISELRRLLNPVDGADAGFALIREGGGYRLQLAEPSSCDARDLERLVESAGRAQRRSDRTAAIEQFAAAAALYRGDLVASVGYPEWVLPERDRLRQVVTHIHEQLVGLHAAAGDHAAAVAVARAGLAHDRHRDTLWRQLVTSLQALDDRAAAAAAQQSYRRLLSELGVAD